jgi:hypothetical protein
MQKTMIEFGQTPPHPFVVGWIAIGHPFEKFSIGIFPEIVLYRKPEIEWFVGHFIPQGSDQSVPGCNGRTDGCNASSLDT